MLDRLCGELVERESLEREELAALLGTIPASAAGIGVAAFGRDADMPA